MPQGEAGPGCRCHVACGERKLDCLQRSQAVNACMKWPHEAEVIKPILGRALSFAKPSPKTHDSLPSSGVQAQVPAALLGPLAAPGRQQDATRGADRLPPGHQVCVCVCVEGRGTGGCGRLRCWTGVLYGGLHYSPQQGCRGQTADMELGDAWLPHK